MAYSQSDVETAFSPQQGATALIVKTISEAQQSIHVAAYVFTSKPIAGALVTACKRGVDVKIILDKSERHATKLGDLFADSCPGLRINSRYAIMHDKFMVIDDKALQVGSFNYTGSAETKNAENVLVLHNDPEIINAYAQQWTKLWDQGFDLPLCKIARKLVLAYVGNSCFYVARIIAMQPKNMIFGYVINPIICGLFPLTLSFRPYNEYQWLKSRQNWCRIYAA